MKGDLVFDPFVGSGQTAFVAKDLERNYLGRKIVEKYYNLAKLRIETGQHFFAIVLTK